MDGPTDHMRLDQLNQELRLMDGKPARPSMLTFGKKAALATPTSAFAAAMRRSAAAMSGRCSSSSLGTLGGTPGTSGSGPSLETSKSTGDWPHKMASACRVCARCNSMGGNGGW